MMDRPSAPRAILLDALGTIVQLVDPFGSLVRELAAREVHVTDAEARSALLAEMRYYRAHCHVAADEQSLSVLRDRCTDVLGAALPARLGAINWGALRAALLAALRFEPFADVEPALARWRATGARLAIVSNWDVSLHHVLEATGLASHFDAVLTSAEVGSSKPDRLMFERALATLDVSPGEAVHIGDSEEEDVAGACTAGIAPILLRRDGQPGPPGVLTVDSLAKLWEGEC